MVSWSKFSEATIILKKKILKKLENNEILDFLWLLFIKQYEKVGRLRPSDNFFAISIFYHKNLKNRGDLTNSLVLLGVTSL